MCWGKYKLKTILHQLLVGYTWLKLCPFLLNQLKFKLWVSYLHHLLNKEVVVSAVDGPQSSHSHAAENVSIVRYNAESFCLTFAQDPSHKEIFTAIVLGWLWLLPFGCQSTSPWLQWMAVPCLDNSMSAHQLTDNASAMTIGVFGTTRLKKKKKKRCLAESWQWLSKWCWMHTV